MDRKDDAIRVPRAHRFPRWIEIVERSGPRGWSIVILPQEIRIDNFHGGLHVHPPQDRGPPEPIPERPQAVIRERIRRHVEARGTVIYEQLLEDLR